MSSAVDANGVVGVSAAIDEAPQANRAAVSSQPAGNAITDGAAADGASAPDVSVIVPIYNTGEPLRRCLESLCNQTLGNVEVIAVNDASQNPLDQQIINEFVARYPFVVPVKLQQNVPVGLVRNTGLDLACGTYVAFVDSDDYADQSMYEQLVTRIQSDGSDLAFCRRNEFDREGLIKPMGFRGNIAGRSLIANDSSEAHEMLMLGLTPFVWDKLYKRSIIEEHGLRMPDTRYSEDVVFVMEYLAFCGSVSLVNQPLYFYNCLSTSGVTNTFSESWLDIPRSMQILVDFYKEQGRFDECEPALYRIAANTWAARMRRLHMHDNRELQIRFVKEYRALFDRNFHDVKERLNEWHADVSHFYNTRRAILYIMRPRKLKFDPRETNKFKPKNIKKKVRSNRVAYAGYRARLAVRKNTALLVANSEGASTDSPFYLLKDLAKRPEWKVFVAAKEPDVERVRFAFYGLEPTVVEWGSDEHLKLLATAQLLVTNTVFPEFFSKRPGQTVLNTWHGTPLKTLGYDMLTPWGELGNSQTQFMMADYLLYPNDPARERIMSCYKLDRLFANKVLMCGYPRSEVLLDEGRRAQVRKELGLDGVKSFMYMPTWRGNGIYDRDFENYHKQVKQILDELDAALDDDVVVYAKLHRYMMQDFFMDNYRHIRACEEQYETYDLLNAMDGLITDYSSVMFDYAVSGRPILLFMYDYDDYMAQRGMYDDPREFPFPQADTTHALAELLNKHTDPHYEPPVYDEFIDRFCAYDTPHNSRNVNDVITGGTSDAVKTLDFAQNAQKSWHVVFADNILDRQAGRDFLKGKLADNVLLLFTKRNFNDRIEQQLRQLGSDITIVITPGQAPMSMLDNARIRLFRKTGRFKGAVRDYYRRELDRLLPGVKVSRMTNFCDDRKFKELFVFLAPKVGL